MPTSAPKIVRAARLLPLKSKNALAAKLLKSVDEPSKAQLDMLWYEEADERLKAHLNGQLKSVPWSEVWRRTVQRRKR